MSLKRTIRNAIKAAFKALDDLPKKCVYKSATGEVIRDHVAGTSTRVTVDYPLPMVAFVRFSEQDKDKDPALLTDLKMLFPRQDLPVQPKQSDTVVDEDGTTWIIVRRLSDPSDELTTLQVRAT